MHLQIFLITNLFLGAIVCFPQHYNSESTNGENEVTETPTPNLPQVTEAESLTVPAEQKEQNDLEGQETFYPIVGAWWGVRPWVGWGGWGGYRPWHGPHWGGHWIGHRPWYGPHWGGGHWGGHWGRTTS